MNAQELWQRYQDWLYFNEDLSLYLDVSRMRFNEEWVTALEPKFAQAFKDMVALEQGAIANPDENWRVGHYWLRNPDLAPEELKIEIVNNLDKIEAFAQKVRNGTIHPPQAPQFTDVLSIGIGGSALGPQFVDDALGADFPPLTIHFIDNTDPAGIDRILNRLKNRLSSTLVIVTSKSGGTLETRNGMLEVRHAYEQQGLNFPAHAVAVTMLGSKMDELERIEGFTEAGSISFKFWDQELSKELPIDIVHHFGDLYFSRLGTFVGELKDSPFPNSENDQSMAWLGSNYPNPFSGVTEIEFKVFEPCNVVLSVFSPLGIKIQEVINAVYQSGSYRTSIDAKLLSPGVWFYRLQATGDGVLVDQTHKMVVK